MKLRQAARIMGAEPIQVPSVVKGTFKFQVTTWIGTAYCVGKTICSSLSGLVEANYRLVKSAVFAAQGRRCFCCGAFAVPLTADHIVPRARGGRDDRFENLRGVCFPCHRKITDNEINPQIDYRVEASMRSRGWLWGGERVGWRRNEDQSPAVLCDVAGSAPESDQTA